MIYLDTPEGHKAAAKDREAHIKAWRKVAEDKAGEPITEVKFHEFMKDAKLEINLFWKTHVDLI